MTAVAWFVIGAALGMVAVIWYASWDIARDVLRRNPAC